MLSNVSHLPTRIIYEESVLLDLTTVVISETITTEL